MYIRKLALGGSPTEIGGKGYRLAELYRSGFRVPEGFIITTKAYDDFMDLNRLDLTKPLKGTIDLSVPSHIANLTHAFYKQIFGGSTVVAVRSSATAEDSPEVSFAGVFKSVLDVQESFLGRAITDVYVSCFSDQAKEYTRQKGIPFSSIKMAIVIQRQIEPKISGVCFTANPVTGKQEYVVEFVQGRSDELLSGKVSPQRLVFDRALRFTENNVSETGVETNVALLEVISDVLKTCEKIENLFGQPQDIEWAVDSEGELYILQSRDITTIKQPVPFSGTRVKGGALLAKGIGVSKGTATGPTRKVLSDLSGDEADRLLQAGDIAVTYILRIDHLPALSKCAGIITADASLLSHTAIRARELGIPCVGGVTNALTLIRDGQPLTIDGYRGLVYLGGVPEEQSIPSKARLIYYNPERVKAISREEKSILCELTDEGIVAYVDRIGDEQSRTEALQILSYALQVDPTMITIDEHGLWEGENSPSVVCDQYMTIKRLQEGEDTAKLLKEGIEATEGLDPVRLRDYIERVDVKAHSLFVSSVQEWRQYKRSHKREFAEKTAELLDQAKRLSGNLIGVAILDVYATYALEKATRELEEKFGVTVQDIFLAATELSDAAHKEDDRHLILKITNQADRELFLRSVEYSKVMQEYKNKRLNVLTHDGYTALDMVNDFWKGGLDDIVLKYQW